MSATPRLRVLAAMSGGVDSAVAAALLAEQGHEVHGVTLRLACYGKTPMSPRACCTLDAIDDARRVEHLASVRGKPGHASDHAIERVEQGTQSGEHRAGSKVPEREAQTREKAQDERAPGNLVRSDLQENEQPPQGLKEPIGPFHDFLGQQGTASLFVDPVKPSPAPEEHPQRID